MKSENLLTYHKHLPRITKQIKPINALKMPLIKSAKKRMRQNEKRQLRNYPVRSKLKTMVKKELKLIKEGNIEEAKKVMPMVYSIIDTAVKKKIIHSNSAARKKSKLALGLNSLEAKK